MNYESIARPYAKAAFEYALEHQALERWSEPLRIAAEVVQDARVKALLVDPRVGQKAVASLILECCASNDEALKTLITLLAENKRLSALPEIAAQYHAHRAAYEKQVDVTVTTVFPLSKADEENLQQALKTRLQREVRLHREEDPSLIGGIMVRAGDWVMDASVKGKLERLMEEMIS